MLGWCRSGSQCGTLRLMARRIYVDADACPVKQEVYRVAQRYQYRVTLVANAWFQIPHDAAIELIVVGRDADAADDWIAERAGDGDLVITADIPLAARCLPQGAVVLRPTGKPFEEQSIGDALATRELMSQLRDVGEITGGPPPFSKKDRSRFLQSLDAAIQALRRRGGTNG